MGELLTVSEVARTLRVDDTTVRRWVRQGVLEGVYSSNGQNRPKMHIKHETLESLLGSEQGQREDTHD